MKLITMTTDDPARPAKKRKSRKCIPKRARSITRLLYRVPCFEGFGW